jgi:hypothetical protein
VASSQKQPEYQNNPFYIASDGLSLIFRLAQSVAIFLAIVCGVSFLSGFAPGPEVTYDERSDILNVDSPEQAIDNVTGALQQVPVEAWIIIGVIATLFFIAVTAIGVIVGGITDYTAAQLAAGKQVTLREAFGAIMQRFFGYLWLQIIVGVKVLLWTLLFIIPGIVMAVRYSLAGTAYFTHNLSANEATKHSARITKGGWLTAFSAFSLFNFITFGLIQPLLQPGTAAVLFRQFDAYDKQSLTKPKTHPLAWVTLFAPIVLVLLFISLITLLVFAFVV